MKLNRESRSQMVVFLLLVFPATCVLLSPLHLVRARWKNDGSENDIVKHEARCQKARSHLANVDCVGYIGIGEPSWMYFATQYALAPALIERNKKLEWMLACFGNEENKEQQWSDQEYEVIEDLGKGLMLYRRRVR